MRLISSLYKKVINIKLISLAANLMFENYEAPPRKAVQLYSLQNVHYHTIRNKDFSGRNILLKNLKKLKNFTM